MNQELENIIWKRRLIKGGMIFFILGLALFALNEYANLSTAPGKVVDYLVIAWLYALGNLFTISIWAKRLWYKPKSLKKFFYFVLISTIIIATFLTIVTISIYQNNQFGV